MPSEERAEPRICPKCGMKEPMTAIILPQGWMVPIGSLPDAYVCPNCGHEEKVKP